MKHVTSLLIAVTIMIGFTNGANASGAATKAVIRNLECQLTNLQDSSFFEESLSLEEYPSIQVRQTDVVIGASLYDLRDSEFAQYRDQSLDGLDQSVVLIQSGGQVKFDMKVLSGQGTLTGQQAGDVEKVIANFVCTN